MQNSMRKVFQILTAMICLASGTAMAQTGFGLRAGATADPNQFHFGVHFASDPLVSNLHFRPNLEIGVEHGLILIAANLEFAYRIPVPQKPISAYLGAGPALVVSQFGKSQRHNTDAGGGFNVLVGLEHKKGLFGELKVGAIDSPEFKFTVGYTFR
jgi:hypothetical protein